MNHSDQKNDSSIILIAEDDPDDRLLIEHAFKASGLSSTLFFVENGEELLDYLFRREKYAEHEPSPRPACILLDLNMPKKDGREALLEIRQNPAFKELPIIVLSTSDSDHDRKYCAEFGVADYITKPDSFAGLMELMREIGVICLA